MVFKLCECAARHWRLLNGAKLLPDVIANVEFINGEKPERTPPDHDAINGIGP